MDLEQYRDDIEAMKLSLMVSSRLGVSREQTIIKSIQHLRRYYEREEKQEYLLGALLQIQAYLEIGFAYRTHSDLFDDILRKCNMTRQEAFPKCFYAAQKVKLNRNQVRGMIRKWSSSPQNTMQITEVVLDIIEKVKNEKTGVHYYVNHIAGMEPDIYELVIQDGECYFHDLKWERYYVFYGIEQCNVSSGSTKAPAQKEKEK